MIVGAVSGDSKCFQSIFTCVPLQKKNCFIIACTELSAPSSPFISLLPFCLILTFFSWSKQNIPCIYWTHLYHLISQTDRPTAYAAHPVFLWSVLKHSVRLQSAALQWYLLHQVDFDWHSAQPQMLGVSGFFLAGWLDPKKEDIVFVMKWAFFPTGLWAA